MSEATPGRPRASVVIPRSRPGEPLDACLSALAAGTVTNYETIVVDSSAAAGRAGTSERATTADRSEDSRSGVGGDVNADAQTDGGDQTRFVVPEQPMPPQEARNTGAALARGETIVFTDADCVPRADWLELLLERHERGARLVGGSVDPDGGGIVERGADICKFSPWLEGLPRGERHTLPTANLSLTRETWEEIGPFRLLAWSGDTELCRRARESGIPLEFEPRATVRHDDPVRLGRFLRERIERGVAYASLRVEIESWSRARCAAYAILSPLIALKLAARGALSAARSGRVLIALVTLPVTSAGYVSWTLGEARAYARLAVSR